MEWTLDEMIGLAVYTSQRVVALELEGEMEGEACDNLATMYTAFLYFKQLVNTW